MPLPGLIAAVPGVISGVQQVAGLFGGSGKVEGPCPGQPSNEAVAAMLANLTAGDRQRLQAAWSAANATDPFPADPFTLAKQSLGGSDCRATSAVGQALRATFLELVNKYAGVTTSNGWTNTTPPTGTVWNPPSPGGPHVSVGGTIAGDTWAIAGGYDNRPRQSGQMLLWLAIGAALLMLVRR